MLISDGGGGGGHRYRYIDYIIIFSGGGGGVTNFCNCKCSQDNLKGRHRHYSAKNNDKKYIVKYQ